MTVTAGCASRADEPGMEGEGPAGQLPAPATIAGSAAPGPSQPPPDRTQAGSGAAGRPVTEEESSAGSSGAAGTSGAGGGSAPADRGGADAPDPDPDPADASTPDPVQTPDAALPPLFPELSTPDNRPPSPDNPAECPATAPEDPWGPCVGLPVYLECSYGTYFCICDWIHWICVG